MLTQRIKDKVLLNTYAKNLTEEYRLKAEDKAPIIGREEETRRCIEVLSKKYKNNVILVGKPGIGKTALVESIAKKLALGDVPSTLKGKELYEVDLQLLSAPNEDHGGPKKRLKQFIAEVEDLNGDVILFIDEVHIIMGGEAEGAMDISNTLKPSLARTNGISVIGATTPYEFHKYMEKDGAITRRFSRINMAEPTPDQAKSILRGRRRGLEIFYGVTVSDAAVDLAVDLSVRYIPSRQLPDKAIDLLDQACASVRVSIDAMPPALDLMQNMIAVRQEELIGEKDPENRARIQEVIDSLEPQFQEQYALWQQQKVTIEGFKEFRVKLEELRNNIEAEQAKEILDAALIADLEKRHKANERNLELAKQRYRQTPNLLIDDLVGEDAVRVTLQGMTGIPLSEIGADEKERMRSLEDKLHEGVIGQDAAVHEVAYAIKRNRLGLGDPTQPMGSFLFLGGSGSGKTELVKQLAHVMFGNRDSMVRIDMGEYKSPASISRLIGAPPGEDKDNQGGYMTEAIKNNPYSIVLFDEAEKAHPAIFDLMLAMLDDGEITDSRGEKVDFRNTIIVLTSNIGSAKILRGVDKHTGKLDPRVEAEVNAMLRNPDRENGGKGFKPEFLNRLDATVVFIPLNREEIERIADIKLNGLRRRLMESRKIRLVYSERIPLNFREEDGPRVDVSYWLAQQYTHDELNLGGRPLNRYIRRYIEDKLVDMLLEEDVPDGACIYIQAKYPPGPRTTVGEDGIERPVQPIIDFKQVTEAEYDLLIKRDPIFKG